MADTGNRRDFSRVETHIDAEVICADKVLSGRLVDVSMRGVRILCDETLPQQSKCEVKCFLGESRESPLCIKANGKVIRSTEDGISIEISEIDLDSFGHLRNLVLMNARDGSQVEDELKSHLGLKKPSST
ncbi:PilZ domain-containing protein [Mariprofundus ferrinatatus]|uniref:PilZ domain-containing protein n=1 Tax=Mariprofundus ferrinatatus TaxID=1921087 RepID=A0A2K8L701_9PROT|nr:PilZ domain-containing protein [Mariprofundus ferrinatatus]ATX82892.1 PilZ domain-containing protein [Mariprofundus ferrinatatus]